MSRHFSVTFTNIIYQQYRRYSYVRGLPLRLIAVGLTNQTLSYFKWKAIWQGYLKLQEKQIRRVWALCIFGVALVVVRRKFKYGSVVCWQGSRGGPYRVESWQRGNFYKSPENPCVSSFSSKQTEMDVFEQNPPFSSIRPSDPLYFG